MLLRNVPQRGYRSGTHNSRLLSFHFFFVCVFFVLVPGIEVPCVSVRPPTSPSFLHPFTPSTVLPTGVGQHSTVLLQISSPSCIRSLRNSFGIHFVPVYSRRTRAFIPPLASVRNVIRVGLGPWTSILSSPSSSELYGWIFQSLSSLLLYHCLYSSCPLRWVISFHFRWQGMTSPLCRVVPLLSVFSCDHVCVGVHVCLGTSGSRRAKQLSYFYKDTETSTQCLSLTDLQ